jgi:CRISPR type III-B/RAMP module RAMP protein Cmr1
LANDASKGDAEELQEHVTAIVPGVSVRREGIRIVLQFNIEFTSPAFLAGANQKQEDCTLTANTFEGGLRWWWRTMHSAHVDHKTLFEMEQDLFGGTDAGSRFSVSIRPVCELKPKEFDFRDKTVEAVCDHRGHSKNSFFKWRISEIASGEFGIPQQPAGKQAIQGILYWAYGMDEKGKQRWFLPSTSKFKVMLRLLTSRAVDECDSQDDAKPTPQDYEKNNLAQIAYSLSLLQLFGGFGSRSRKGFGSFTTQPNSSVEVKELADKSNRLVENAKKNASEYRTFFWSTRKRNNNGRQAEASANQRLVTPSLDHIHGPFVYTAIGGGDPQLDRDKHPFKALDRLGTAMKQFAYSHKHKRAKARLGLPRKDIRLDPNHQRLEEDYVLVDYVPRWAASLEKEVRDLKLVSNKSNEQIARMERLERLMAKRSEWRLFSLDNILRYRQVQSAINPFFPELNTRRNKELQLEVYYNLNRVERLASPIFFSGQFTNVGYAFTCMMFDTRAIDCPEDVAAFQVLYPDPAKVDNITNKQMFDEINKHLYGRFGQA